MFNRIFVIVVACLVLGCRPCKVDTQTKWETIRVETPVLGAKLDSALPLRTIKEPVFIDKTRIKLEIRERNDTVFVEAECPPDTVYQEIEIPVEVNTSRELAWQERPLFGYLIALSIILAILITIKWQKN